MLLSNCVAEEDSWDPLDSKGIKPVTPKGNQSWILIGRTDAEAKVPIPWPSNGKGWLNEMTLILGKIEAGGEGSDRE